MVRQTLTGVLLFAGLAVFVGLGVWQVQRMVWKDAVLARLEARIAGDPVALPDMPDPEADRYLPVTLDGEIGEGELHVLVSSRDYGAGFRIIAPFTTGEGRRIMVDRGYVPTAMKDAARSTGAMRVTGNLHWPDERDAYTPEDDPEGNWWYARDVDRMAGVLGTEPVLVIARAPTDPQVLAMPVSAEAIPNDHLGYAATWFLLAASWVVMTVFALWRIRRRAAAGEGETAQRARARLDVDPRDEGRGEGR